MSKLLAPAARGLWALLQSKSAAAEQADQPQGPVFNPQQPMYTPMPESMMQDVPENLQVDDSTNSLMIPKSMSVQVKRPLGYGRPAREDETLESLMSKYGEASERALADQNKGVDKLEGQLGEMREQVLPQDFMGKLQHANLKPLMAYFDSMNGTQTAQAYQAPESLTERQKMILNLEDAIQKRRGEVSKGEADALKEKINFYLKDKDDPMKDIMAMTRINYMNSMANASGNRFRRAEDDKIESDVQKLADKVANAQDLQTSVQSLEAGLGFKLKDFDESTGTIKGKKIDLPGTAIPGIGRVTFYDKQARDLQSRFGRIFNVELKDRSGAAVTSPEMARLKEEFNAGRFNDETELIGAVKRYKSAADQELKNREAAYRGTVKERYRSRGGQLSDDFKGSAPERKSWGGKNYELRGDQWVEVK